MWVDPARTRRSRDARLATALVMMVFVVAVGHLFVRMSRHRSALITADPYSYISFAQELARGHASMTGPVADAAAAFSDTDVLAPGPVWNTTTLPGGKTVFTIAIGYPLALTAGLLAGGIWLCTHLNVFVLMVVVLLLFLSVWIGMERSLPALCAAVMAAIFFIHSHPATFLQFSNPWREPVFYACVLGAVLCLVRFDCDHRVRMCAAAGLLLGYACAVKEANAIYAAWLGLCLVSSRAFRAHPARGRVLLAFAAAAAAGIAPLLIQNAMATGNPLLSLQFLRETMHYSLTEAGQGLATGNTASTFHRYVGLYRAEEMFWFRTPFLLVAGYGLARSIRYPFGRMCAGLLCVHAVLYLQWGNADYRHMFFTHLFYAAFLGVGFAMLVHSAASVARVPDRVGRLLPVIPVLIAGLWPSPWAAQSPVTRFEYRDAIRLVEEIRRNIPPNSVLLSNRTLRDVMAIYGGFDVIRLHDLAMIHPEQDIRRLMDWFREHAVEIYFLDNFDFDPTNLGRVNWAEADRQWLLWQHNLEPAFALDQEAYNLGRFLNGEALHAYRVRPWVNLAVARDLALPEGGAAFLFLNPRAAGTNLSVRLNDRPVPLGSATGLFVPVDGLDLRGPVALECRMAGRPVPALDDVGLIGWHEEIHLPCGTDASPPDSGLFPQSGYAEYDAGYRILTPPTTLRIPVRNQPDLFTTIGLGLNLEEDNTETRVYVDSGRGQEHELDMSGLAAWFPASHGGVGHVDVTLRTDPASEMKLNRLKSIATHRSLVYERPKDVLGAGLRGMLAPDAAGPGPHEWSASVNGEPRWSGSCLSDPRRSANAFAAVLSADDAQPRCTIEFTGAGLIAPTWVPAHRRLEISPADDTIVFLDEGFFSREGSGVDAFCWSHARAVVRVPVTPEPGAYRLTLDAADGSSARDRPLHVAFGGHSTTIDLPRSRGVHTIEIPNNSAKAGMAELVFEIEPWYPGEDGTSDDPRALGFLFYGLRWEPVPNQNPAG